MRWGYSYEADASYFILENLGLGVKFHNFHSGDSMPVSAVVNGNIVEGVSEDNVDIYFIGPIATYRLPSRNRNNDAHPLPVSDNRITAHVFCALDNSGVQDTFLRHFPCIQFFVPRKQNAVLNRIPVCIGKNRNPVSVERETCKQLQINRKSM